MNTTTKSLSPSVCKVKSKKFKYRHDFNKNNAKMTNNNSSEDYYD